MPDTARTTDLDVDDVARATAAGAGLYTAGKIAPEGAARLLGAKRVYHGTSRDAAKAIRRSGLLAGYGGNPAGGSSLIQNPHFIASSTGRIHVAEGGLPRVFAARAHANLAEEGLRAAASGRKLTPDEAGRAFMKGILHNKGAVVEGAVPYQRFVEAFEPDPDHMRGAFRSTESIPAGQIRQAGGISHILRARANNLRGYIKANPGRFATGALAAAGSAALTYAGYKAVQPTIQKLRGIEGSDKLSSVSLSAMADEVSRTRWAA